MALYGPVPLQRLTEQLERLPGIGHKSAQRLAFYLLHMPEDAAADFIQAFTEARQTIHECATCCDLTDGEVCPVCADENRDRSVICVVEDSRDVMALERTREYHGVYHVLHGLISPMDGITPDQLRIKELVVRVADETVDVQEVIMATNPTAEGDTTALYLAKLIAPFGVKVTRLAYGIPVGGDLEYADDVTLRRSLQGRQEI